ncbi:MAG: Y-family DNA polymerase [Hyphomicrobiales bacterium]
MKRRVICLWFPALAADRAMRQTPSWQGKPLAVIAESGNKVYLHAVNQVATSEGLTPGMLLASARATCPGLVTRSADMAADGRFFTVIAAWCRRYSPLIARDGQEGVFIDITGCAHLFNGEEAMLGDVMQRLARFGLSVRAGLAGTPGAAWALAHYGENATIAPPSRLADSLANLPVAGLRLAGETTDMLNRLGLRTIGALYGLPRASLAARFGREMVERLDQALGAASEPLDFDMEAKKFRAIARFAEPIGRLEDVEAALARLLRNLREKLVKEARGSRRLTLRLVKVDNSASTIIIGTASPSRDADGLARLFHDRLDGLDAGFGIERMVLEATVIEPAEDEQGALPHTSGKTGISTPLSHLLDRLANRLGFDSVLTVAPAESHLPERAVTAFSAAFAPVGNTPFPLASMTRPSRLFEPPQWLAAFTPAIGEMRLWGNKRCVRMMAGPERITPEWWHDDAAWRGGARDYWWVEDKTSNQRLWIYREENTERWFLHGLGN